MSLSHNKTNYEAIARSRSYIPVFIAVILFAIPVFGQQTLPATKTVEPSAAAPISNSSEVSSTEKDQFRKKKVVVLSDKLIAEKATLVPKETKPASPGNTDDAQQAAPAPVDSAELAKKLSNPVSSLITLPIQANFDFRMGTGSGWRSTTNIQPVIPVALNKDWNLISRTIIPIIHQGNVTAPGASQSGLGDTVQSIFFSPNKTEPFIWGAGPAILIPTATNSFLGGKQLGIGPTVVVLKQQSGWTVGALWNHIWRVAGGEGRPRVNSDFLQPFLNYSTKDGWTYGVNTEATYDWTGNSWGVPLHFTVQKVVRFGKQPVQFTGAMRCWATSPTGGPEGCGLRMAVTPLFPKK